MTARRNIRLVPIAALICSMGALTGCQSGSSSSTPWSSKSASTSSESSFDVAMAAVTEADFSQRHQFYYFPNAGVYRDCDENRWLWSEDGGMTWNAGPQLPSQISLGDEIPFAVSLNMNDPVIEHQTIAAAYPADSAFGPATATVRGSNDFDN